MTPDLQTQKKCFQNKENKESFWKVASTIFAKVKANKRFPRNLWFGVLWEIPLTNFPWEICLSLQKPIYLYKKYFLKRKVYKQCDFSWGKHSISFLVLWKSNIMMWHFKCELLFRLEIKPVMKCPGQNDGLGLIQQSCSQGCIKSTRLQRIGPKQDWSSVGSSWAKKSKGFNSSDLDHTQRWFLHWYIQIC